jgi:hypothetical protein
MAEIKIKCGECGQDYMKEIYDKDFQINDIVCLENVPSIEYKITEKGEDGVYWGTNIKPLPWDVTDRIYENVRINTRDYKYSFVRKA